MSQRPLRAVAPDAQQFLASTQHFPREVVQRIYLVRPGRDDAESRPAQLTRERPNVCDAKLDLDFSVESHRNRRRNGPPGRRLPIRCYHFDLWKRLGPGGLGEKFFQTEGG